MGLADVWVEDYPVAWTTRGTVSSPFRRLRRREGLFQGRLHQRPLAPAAGAGQAGDGALAPGVAAADSRQCHAGQLYVQTFQPKQALFASLVPRPIFVILPFHFLEIFHNMIFLQVQRE